MDLSTLWTREHSSCQGRRVSAAPDERIDLLFLIQMTWIWNISFRACSLNQWEAIIKWTTPANYKYKIHIHKVNKVIWISTPGMKWTDSTLHLQTRTPTINFNACTWILKIINHIKVRDQNWNIIWNKIWLLETWEILGLLWKDLGIR